MKNQRRKLILKAVREEEITTQEQLREYLLDHGVCATQATVSRDIRDLRLIKTKRGNGKTTYEAPQATATADLLVYQMILNNSLLSADYAGNIVCVRCGAGMAQGACAAIDAIKMQGVVGTLAGEDTIFILCRDEAQARIVMDEIVVCAAETDE
ncbi:MAG: hypothetical protein LBB67_07820 [Oscillospiraceae bacterium]|jgi:transcriptional regulator of arginine metabolism|nr:hypothetical protein [Oscillospiraceae bacterium]